MSTQCKYSANRSKDETISDSDAPLEVVSNFFVEDLPTKDDQTKSNTKQNKKRKKYDSSRDGNIKIICEICGAETTLRDFDQHEEDDYHQQRRRELRRKERKERKRRTRANKKKKMEEGEIQTPAKLRMKALPQVTSQTDKVKHIREKYSLRYGDPLPHHHQAYINVLAIFLSLRYAFNSEKNFKISLTNNKWNEFGDIVIEIGNGAEITEIQALQCKQIQHRNSIMMSYLSAEMGKFSLKSRYEILKKLQKKLNFDKTYFKLYTVSNLIINRDTFTSVVYDDDVIKTWKNKMEGELWYNREIEITDYKKLNFFNTTDESDDISKFKIRNHNDPDLDNILNRFSMFTNQKKLESLKHLIKSMINNKFENSRDVSNDLIKFVGDYFKFTSKQVTGFKLSKKEMLLKMAEFLLESYSLFPECTTEERDLHLWNDVIQNFDITIIKNQPDLVRKIYCGIDYILQQESQFSSNDSGTLTIEKRKVRNETLALELFDGFSCDCRELYLSDMHLVLWKANLAPLLLIAKDERDLYFINTVVEFLKEHSFEVKFIVLTNNFKIDHNIFSKNLDIFLSLEDLKYKNEQSLNDILKEVEIDFLNFSVFLKDVVECNNSFLESVTPDALLNMLWGDYSFEENHLSMTEEIVENTLVFKDDIIGKICQYFENSDSDSDTEKLSYVINHKGKVTSIQVPPDV